MPVANLTNHITSPSLTTSPHTDGRFVPLGLDELRGLVIESWSGESSSAKDWSRLNTAKGQSAATACVVREHLGGEIEWCDVRVGNEIFRHYSNLVKGQRIDLTAVQYPENAVIPDERQTEVPKTPEATETFNSMWDFLMADPAHKNQYVILSATVSDCLARRQPQLPALPDDGY